jgi:glycosyltransferase involved in cell wall biosynthesis
VREALAAGLPVVATPVAAREQEPHPLLAVEPDTAGFVDHVVRRLTAPVRHQPSPGGASLRTWRTVAEDYLDEVGAAIRSGGTGLPSGKSRA